MPDRVALFLQDSYPLRDATQYVRYAETRGFEAIWQAEPRLDRDALVALAAYAANTNRIKLGSGVVNNWTRNAATLAMSFITLDDLAQDRIICGVGTWVDELAVRVGVRRDRPLLALREMIQVLRTLFDGQRASFQGQFIRLDNVSIGARRIDPRVIPIYIAATSPAMMALGGEIADGVLLKEYGEDIQQGKLTMPLIALLRHAPDEMRRRVVGILRRNHLASTAGNSALDRDAKLDVDRSELEYVVGLVQRERIVPSSEGAVTALDYCRAKARAIIDDAWKDLDAILPPTIAKVQLRLFSNYVLERNY